MSQRLTLNQTNKVVYNALGQVATNYDFMGQRTEYRYDRYGRVTNKFYFVSGAHPSNSVSYAYNQLNQLTNITERHGSDADAIYAANTGEPEPRYFARMISFAGRTVPKWGALVAAVSLLWWSLNLPFGRRLRNILAWYYLRGGWNVAAVGDRRTRRLRLPSFFWRAVTLVTLVVLIIDDPSWDNLFNARATCDIPSNSSTLTTRSTNFAYDVEGRLTQVNAPEGVINYGYDLVTGRHTSTCTTNSYVSYTYDALARMKTVVVSKINGICTNQITTYGYDAAGNRSSVVLPNGITNSYQYDGLNRLTNLTHQAGGTNLAIYSYKLDATGRRTNATEVMWQETGGYVGQHFILLLPTDILTDIESRTEGEVFFRSLKEFGWAIPMTLGNSEPLREANGRLNRVVGRTIFI